MIGGQQGCSYHHMMFGPVHVAEGHRHQFLYNLYRVLGGFVKAKLVNGIYTLCVALIADVMSLFAAGFTIFILVANSTLHKNFLF
jgi:hypothetical protein